MVTHLFLLILQALTIVSIFSDVICPKDFVFGTRIAPRKFKSSVLTWNQIDKLWEWIPDRIYVLEPIVVFCSDENGECVCVRSLES